MKNYFSSDIQVQRSIKTFFIQLGINIVCIGIAFNVDSYEFDRLSAPWALFTLMIFINLCLSAITIPYALQTDIFRGIKVRGEAIQSQGKITTLIVKTGLLFVLSVVTCFWLFPLYLKRKLSYLLNHCSLGGQKFIFKGKARNLLLYYLVAPAFVFFVVPSFFVIMDPNPVVTIFYTEPSTAQIALTFLLTFLFLAYIFAITLRWMIHIEYNRFNIHTRSKARKFFSHWLVVVVGSFVSLGIALPILSIWIFNRYIKDIEATWVDETIVFESDISIQKDTLFIYGQLTLILLSLFIYFPFAVQKVMNRFIPKISYRNVSTK
ncbi:DUF898 family protein [Prolixibacteraceae bacterium]|nr:DUF898 family protein [Prolixibacteraceae bacterium]